MSTILGIDPGLASTGIGVLRSSKGRLQCLFYGVIETSPSMQQGQRLLKLYQALEEVLAKWKPEAAGLEALYFAKNVTSALPVAEARGVILLCLEKHGIPCLDFSALALKQAVTGNGKAEKRQVQEMVKIILGLQEIPRPDHAADALAAAIARAHGGQL